VDVSLADKIASLRHALLTGSPISRRKLAHYGETLQLALGAGQAPRLSGQLGGTCSPTSPDRWRSGGFAAEHVRMRDPEALLGHGLRCISQWSRTAAAVRSRP
jgi:hypothetical protein